jgi:hypothetical protein
MPALASRLRRSALALGAVVALTLGGATRAAPPSLADSPILDFRLSLFDDETGQKTSDLRGRTAIYRGTEQLELDLHDFTLTLLNRKGTLALQVAGPTATLQTKTRIATGDDLIDVQGPGYSLSGKQWRCDERARKISLREDARVVFQAPLLDILK